MLADKVRSAKGVAAATSTYYLATVVSSVLRVYPWTSASGYGTVYGAAPSIGANVSQARFSPSGNAIFVDGSVSNIAGQAWPWTAAGFGTKYADAAVTNANISVVGVSPAGDAVLFGRDVGPPYTYAYRWTTASGFGTQYSAPGSPSGAVRNIEFAPNAGAVVMATSVGPANLDAYPWSSAGGFGTKFSNPATSLPTQVGQQTYLKFSSTGGALVYGGSAASASPFVMGYPWSNSTGFGTKYANPAVLPPGNPNEITFSPAGDVVAFAHSASPFITAYAWSDATGFGTKFANPGTLSAGAINMLAFAPTGTEIAVGRTTAAALAFYRWSGSGFGAYVTDGGTAPTAAVGWMAFGTITA